MNVSEMIPEFVMLAIVLYFATRVLTRPRRTTLEFSDTQAADSPPPCLCGSHHPPIGPAKHYYTLDEWQERQQKFADRKGKRMTKLSRQIRAHDRVAMKLQAMSKQELQSEKGLKQVELLNSLRKKCQDEEARIAKKIGKKWMLCRSCWNVSRRYIHDESVQDRLCYLRDKKADKAHSTYFHLAKILEEAE